MKLVYTLAALAAAAVTTTSGFELNTKNIRQLQSQINNKLDAKYQAKRSILRNKRSLFNNLLNDIAKEIDLNAYNNAAASCQVSTANFWNDCRQCVAQQCTSYMSTQCNFAQPLNAVAGDDRFAKLIANQLGDISPSITDMNEFLSILSAHGIKADVDYNMAGADLKLSTDDVSLRRRRRGGDDVDCQQFIESSENMSVKCVPSQLVDAGDDEFEFETNDVIMGNWAFNIQGTHEHEMLNQGTNSDGATIIKLAIVPQSSSDDGDDLFNIYGQSSFLPNDLKLVNNDNFQAMESSERSFPVSSNGESIICSDAVSCEKLGGNYAYDEENEFMPNRGSFNCNGMNGNANCDNTVMDLEMYEGGMPINDEAMEADVPNPKDCDEEEGANGQAQASEQIADDYEEDVLRQDLTDAQFCDLIGGCPDVPFVRRSSRGERTQRSALAQQFCKDVETLPATCLGLGLNCADCSRSVSAACPEYHALRQELSAKIDEVQQLTEQYQSITKRDSVELKFLHALKMSGASALYVQSAKYNIGSQTVDLVIKVGSGAQASQVLARGKVKSAEEFDQFTDKMSNAVVNLI